MQQNDDSESDFATSAATSQKPRLSSDLRHWMMGYEVSTCQLLIIHMHLFRSMFLFVWFECAHSMRHVLV